MTLRRVPGGWDMQVNHTINSKLRFVDGLLDTTLPPPTPDKDEPDLLGRVPDGSLERVVVVDRFLMRHPVHGPAIRAWLARHGITPHFVLVSAGERHKTLVTVVRILRALTRARVPRHGNPIRVLVIGGGVVTDTAGLAAALHRRGVPRINVATTLVGMIDAALAAKTAVDLFRFKNRVGAYDPAELVIIDRRFLATLPRRRLSDGLAEIVKIAIATDATLFDELERHGVTVLDEAFQGLTAAGERAAVAILDGATAAILGELEPNLLELDSARPAYLGHNWSPAVEMAALRASRSLLPSRRRPWLYHGEAVALDILLSAGIAVDDDRLHVDDYHRIASLLDILGLPTWDPLMANERLLAKGLKDTIGQRGNQQLVPLPDGIGKVYFDNAITPERVRSSIARQRKLTGRSLA